MSAADSASGCSRQPARVQVAADEVPQARLADGIAADVQGEQEAAVGKGLERGFEVPGRHGDRRPELAEPGGGGNGECLCQLPVDAVQQHQVLDQQAEFLARGRDLLAHLLEDVEQVGALSHEDLGLGPAQVRVAQGGDVGPQCPVGQGSHQAEEFCPRSSKTFASTLKSASVRCSPASSTSSAGFGRRG